MTPRRRRSSDIGTAGEIVMTAVGVGIILAAIALAAFTAADRWVVLGIAALGGVLIPHSRVVSAIAAWRGGRRRDSFTNVPVGDDTTQPPVQPGE